jgi:hypothetical protein
MRRVLLFVLYLVIVTPYGLAARGLRDPFQRKIRRQAASHWSR